MAKKTSRIIFHLVCKVCGEQNYTTTKSKMNTPEKVIIKKFCRRCGKHTEHEESTRMK